MEERPQRRSFVVTDPSSTKAIARVADGGIEDALEALNAATAAFAAWSEGSPRSRTQLLRTTARLMHERRQNLATVITLEMGKPLAEAEAEVDYAVSFFDWFADEALRVRGEVGTVPDGNAQFLTERVPVGPSLLITPWDFPLAMGARKIAPALAAGCTCVVKPAEQTPLSMLALAAILDEAGAPEGVVNVVPTTRAADVVGALLSDSRLRKLSFTGSTEVGKLLLAQASSSVLRTSMELGGNAPFIVLPDADMRDVLRGALLAKLRNGGQACTAANRIFAHHSIAAELAELLARAMARMPVGRGLAVGTEIGPLIDSEALAKVERLTGEAIRAGAEVVGVRRDVPETGHFFAPLTLTGVPMNSTALTEEIFGPVAFISEFADDDEAVARANETTYGLSAYVYSGDVGRALRLARRLEVGMVGVNRGSVSDAAIPFGGVKHSGLGREGSTEGIREYLQTRVLCIDNGTGIP